MGVSFLNRVAGWISAAYLKRKSNISVFPVNFAISFRVTMVKQRDIKCVSLLKKAKKKYYQNKFGWEKCYR